jgi:bacillopeptidase F (M6 metalloprotease family)
LLIGGYKGLVSSLHANPLAGLSAWCGDPQDWTRYVVDLDNYAGQTVSFRFRLGSDSSVGRAPDGLAIDDVTVQACGPLADSIFVDGFDPANAH